MEFTAAHQVLFAAVFDAAHLAARIPGATTQTIREEATRAGFGAAPTEGEFEEVRATVHAAVDAAMALLANTATQGESLALLLPDTPRTTRAARLARLQSRRIDVRRARRIVRLVLLGLRATHGHLPPLVTRAARIATERLRPRYKMKKGK